MKLEADRGGEGSRLLVLLHGLGATRQVWRRFVETRAWPGAWIAPDLRGHGVSPHAKTYALGQHAADVAELIVDSGAWSKIVILGHSMGGAVALALASGWFGISPARVFGLGIKVAWSEADLAGMAKLAASPMRSFADRDEAIARYLKVSGLSGLIEPSSAEALSGVVQRDGGWRFACDPATASVGAPPMRGLLAAARTPVHLACGETDAMVSVRQLAEHDRDACALSGGHNVMVENPRAVRDWLNAAPP